MSFALLVADQFSELYPLVYVMCGTQSLAGEHLVGALQAVDQAAVLRSARPGRALLGEIMRHLEVALGRNAERTFEQLDSLLCSEPTELIDPEQPPLSGRMRRLQVITSEIKRSCLAAVVTCLPPGVRVAFVLRHVVGLTDAEVGELLRLKPETLAVRLTRARRRIAAYLEPRCRHVDPGNPCYCAGRMVVALQTGFLTLPSDELLDTLPLEETASPSGDAIKLFARLPRVHISEHERAALLAAALHPPTAPAATMTSTAP